MEQGKTKTKLRDWGIGGKGGKTVGDKRRHPTKELRRKLAARGREKKPGRDQLCSSAIARDQ